MTGTFRCVRLLKAEQGNAHAADASNIMVFPARARPPWRPARIPVRDGTSPSVTHTSAQLGRQNELQRAAGGTARPPGTRIEQGAGGPGPSRTAHRCPVPIASQVTTKPAQGSQRWKREERNRACDRGSCSWQQIRSDTFRFRSENQGFSYPL